MANYTTKFCISLKLTPEQADWVKGYDALLDDLMQQEDVTQERLAEFDLTENGDTRLEELNHDLGLSITEEDDEFLIHDTCGAPNLDYLIHLLQETQERFGIDEVWACQYSHSCDRVRPDAYGGGMIAVSRTNVIQFDAAEIMESAVRDMTADIARATDDPTP